MMSISVGFWLVKGMRLVIGDGFFQLAVYIFSSLNLNRNYFFCFQGFYGYGGAGE